MSKSGATRSVEGSDALFPLGPPMGSDVPTSLNAVPSRTGSSAQSLQLVVGEVVSASCPRP